MKNPDATVIEFALTEEIGGQNPPDLCDRILDRAANRNREFSSSRSRYWRAAALLLAGSAVFAFVLWSTRHRPTDSQTTETDAESKMKFDSDGPRDLEEFRAWLSAMPRRVVSVRATGVRELASGTYVPLYQHELQRLLSGILSERDFISITGKKRIAWIAAALEKAPAAPTTTENRPAEHILELTHKDRTLRVGIVGLGTFPLPDPERVEAQFFVLGCDGPIPIALDRTFLELLYPGDLVERTEFLIRGRGIALGDAGLAWLERDEKKLSCVGLTSASLSTLNEFSELEALDLSASPRLQTPSILAALAKLGIEKLIVNGLELSSAAANTLGQFSTLRELSVIGPSGHPLHRGAWAGTVGDAVVASWAPLTQLEELHIPGAVITDSGLMALAGMPNLQELFVPQCADLRGLTLGALHVDALTISADTTDLTALRNSEGLSRIAVFGETRADEISALLANAGLTRIMFAENDVLDDATIDEVLSRIQGRELRLHFFLCPKITRESCVRWEKAAPGCTFHYDPK